MIRKDAKHAEIEGIGRLSNAVMARPEPSKEEPSEEAGNEKATGESQPLNE